MKLSSVGLSEHERHKEQIAALLESLRASCMPYAQRLSLLKSTKTYNVCVQAQHNYDMNRRRLVLQWTSQASKQSLLSSSQIHLCSTICQTQPRITVPRLQRETVAKEQNHQVVRSTVLLTRLIALSILNGHSSRTKGCPQCKNDDGLPSMPSLGSLTLMQVTVRRQPNLDDKMLIEVRNSD